MHVVNINNCVSKMFFVVYNVRSGEYVILPREWILEVEKHFCKFLKTSINRGQKFWCFYTTNEDAFEVKNDFNVPKSSYKPNFQLLRTAANGDECFIGVFESVEDTYKLAHVCAARRRLKNPPKNYNDDRLNETPIPKIPSQSAVNNRSADAIFPENDDTSEDEDAIEEQDEEDPFAASKEAIRLRLQKKRRGSGGNSSSDSGENSHSEIFNKDDVSETDNVTNEEANGDQFDAFEEVLVQGEPDDANNSKSTPEETNAVSDSTVVNQIDKKPDIVVLRSISMVNTNSIADILDADSDLVEVVNSDDMTITYDRSKGFAMPFAATDGLIKRQNDLMSGDVPFYTNKNGRVYKIGRMLREIPYAIVEKFMAWRNPPFKNDATYDRRLVYALLFALVEAEDLARFMVPQEVLDFIQNVVNIRCDGQGHRLDAIQSYIEEVCRSKREEMRRGQSMN